MSTEHQDNSGRGAGAAYQFVMTIRCATDTSELRDALSSLGVFEYGGDEPGSSRRNRLNAARFDLADAVDFELGGQMRSSARWDGATLSSELR